MKLFKLILTISLLLILNAPSQGQSSQYNLVRNYMKYWKARGWLIGDENNRDQRNGFMVVGGETGMSIPAELLNF